LQIPVLRNLRGRGHTVPTNLIMSDKHQGADAAEFIEQQTGVQLPQQVSQDIDVVESFLPAAAVQGIDDIEDTFNRPTKKQKSQSGKPKFTTMAKTYTLRRRNYRPKLSNRIKKLESCYSVETHHKDTDISAAAVATNSLRTYALLSTIPQGTGLNERRGKYITLKGISLSINLDVGVTQNVDFYLVRPANSNSSPVITDFSVSGAGQPGQMLDPEKGWMIRHWMSRQPCYNGTINCYVPIRNMKVTYDGTNPVDNNVYFVVLNETGANVTYTGTVRAWFVG